MVHGVHRWCACSVAQLRTVRVEAKMYHQVRLWEQGIETVNLVLAYPQGGREPWAVITDETPTLKTLWQYGFRFRVEELFLDSKSGVFGLWEAKFRCNSFYFGMCRENSLEDGQSSLIQTKGIQNVV